MILIIEGMDNCGKSYLINDLRKQYFKRHRTITHHSSSPPTKSAPDIWEQMHYDDLFSTFKQMVQHEGYDVLLDRFHLGAIVYGAKYRNSSPHAMKTIDRRHLENYDQAALLLLTDTNEGIMSRDDGLSIEQSAEEYDDVRRRFTEAFKESYAVNKLHVNITANGGIDKTLSTVIQWLDQIESIKLEASY